MLLVAALWQWRASNPSYEMWEMQNAGGDVLIRGQFPRPVLPRAVVLALLPPSVLVMVWLALRRRRGTMADRL